MRFNRDIAAVIILLFVFIMGGFLLGGHPQPQSRRVGALHSFDPSIYNDRATGSQGVFAWVQAEGYTAQPWRLPWSRLNQSPSHFMLVIAPHAAASTETLTGGEQEAASDPTALVGSDAATLRAWVARGNTALLLSSDLTDEASRPDAFASALGITVNPLSSDTGRKEFAPLQPAVDTQGIMSIHSEMPGWISQTTVSGVSLFGDKAGPVVLVKTYGKGHLFVIADSLFVSNDNLGRSENARFLDNLLAHYAPRGTLILFDEYHHGDVALKEGGGVWAALGWPLQLALIQGALAFLILIGFLGIRFGPPIPLIQRMTRNSGEYITSLAGLYQRAGASVTALDILYHTFVRDLTARLALAPDADPEQILDAATKRGQTDRQRLRHLLEICPRYLNNGKVTEDELLDLVHRMEHIRKDIGIV